MSSFNVCSRCLRVLRQSIRAETPQLTTTAAPKQRYLSASSSQWRQATPQKSRSQSKPPQLSIRPTTTGTITSNITATPPSELRSSTPASKATSPQAQPTEKPPSPEVPDSISTAHMQEQIKRSLKTKPGFMTRIAQGVRRAAPDTASTYIVYGAADRLFKSCASRADYAIPEDQRSHIPTGKGPPKTADGADIGKPTDQSAQWWYTNVGLQPTFSTWSHVTFLHMYILTVRLRNCESEADFKNYQRYLIEHFSNAAEDKMVVHHNISARSVRGRYLKDLFIQWRGVLAAYDEGLVKGDAVLGAAVWRNLFRGVEDVDWEKVALVVAYMRRAIRNLAKVDLERISFALSGETGLWTQNEKHVQELVTKESKGLKQPLSE